MSSTTSETTETETESKSESRSTGDMAYEVLRKLGKEPDSCVGTGTYGHLITTCQNKTSVFKIMLIEDPDIPQDQERKSDNIIANSLEIIKAEYEIAKKMGDLDIGPKILSYTEDSGLVIIEMERMYMSYRLYIHYLGTKDQDVMSSELTKLYKKMIEAGVFCIDLKPGNVMVDVDDNDNIIKVRLIDFGGDYCQTPIESNVEDAKLLIRMQLMMAYTTTLASKDVRLFENELGSDLCDDIKYALWDYGSEFIPLLEGYSGKDDKGKHALTLLLEMYKSKKDYAACAGKFKDPLFEFF